MTSSWSHTLKEMTDLYGPETAAEMVLNDAEIQADEDFQAWILSLIKCRARLIARNHTRNIERDVMSHPTADERLRLAKETFILSNGERVLWLEATVDQHMERIAFQQSLIGTIEGDIDRHMVAIKLIEDAGVKCLADLDAVSI